jgi:integrase
VFFHTAVELTESVDSFPKKIRGRGKIRLQARDSKCSVCGGSFECVDERGYFCPKCGTTPRRFYLDVPYKGKRVRIFCDTQGKPLDSNERAYDMLAHVNMEIENHTFDPSKYVKSELQEYYVMTICDKFLNFKIDSIAPSYQKDYKRIVGVIKSHYGAMDVRALRKIHIINFKEHLEKDFKLSGKSRKNILDLFKTLLNYCRNDIEIISSVPVFPEVEVTPFNFKWLAQEDQIALFVLVPDEDKPILAFLMLHGCRPSEVRALKVKDVDVRMKTVTISATFSSRTYRERRKGKKSKAFTIPIHPELQAYVMDRVKNNLPEAFLFVNPRTGLHYSLDTLDRIWAAVRRKAKLDKGLRLYDATRHSFASNLSNGGVSIYKVSRLLGHSSIKMTEKYAHSEAENLRADIQRLSLNCQQTVSKNANVNES